MKLERAITYDRPLTVWISDGLTKSTLNELVSAINSNKSLDAVDTNFSNQKYLEKLLREEAIKQFKDKEQPALQALVNGIDAQQNNKLDGFHAVYTNISTKKIQILDYGTSMGLRDLLSQLFLPFSNDKDGIDSIGYFGVGFLSNLKYCLQENAKIKVITDNKLESYDLTFYCESKSAEVSDLRLKIKKRRSNPKKSFTQVTIQKRVDVDKYTDYLTKNVQFFPKSYARLYINSKLVNDKSDVGYSIPVELEWEGKPLTRYVGISITKEEDVNLCSQGILVSQQKSVGERGITIILPSGVRLVEGRDEFKIDKNYHLAANAVFQGLQRYFKDEKVSPQTAVELLASTATSLRYSSIKEIPNFKSIKHKAVGDRSYIINKTRWDILRNFFGPNLDKIAFPVSASAEKSLSEEFNSINSLMQKYFDDNITEFAPTESFYVSDFIKKSKTHNLVCLVDLLDNTKIRDKLKLFDNIKVVSHKKVQGASPVYMTDKNLYVNARHPLVRGKQNPEKSYGLVCNFLQHPYIRPKLNFKTILKVEDFLKDRVWALGRQIRYTKTEEEEAVKESESKIKRREQSVLEEDCFWAIEREGKVKKEYTQTLNLINLLENGGVANV